MQWSCFGDTVNTAARLEQTCEMCHIQISEDTYRLLPPELQVFKPTQGVHMKVKRVV
jgi:class 3 adenylate cyclase